MCRHERKSVVTCSSKLKLVCIVIQRKIDQMLSGVPSLQYVLHIRQPKNVFKPAIPPPPPDLFYNDTILNNPVQTLPYALAFLISMLIILLPIFEIGE